jgi:uncharacterized protein YicC (UPF0701 family)
MQKHFRAIVALSQEYAVPGDDSVAREIDALQDHLRTFSSALAKMVHLQATVGRRFDDLSHELSSFAFQRRRGHAYR